MIKELDPQQNGFITLTEVEGLFRKLYPALRNVSLSKILRPFAAIQNKSSIDYKSLLKALMRAVTKTLAKANLAGTPMSVQKSKIFTLTQERSESKWTTKSLSSKLLLAPSVRDDSSAERSTSIDKSTGRLSLLESIQLRTSAAREAY